GWADVGHPGWRSPKRVPTATFRSSDVVYPGMRRPATWEADMRRIAVLVLVVAAATACTPGRPPTGSHCADIDPPAVAESPAPVPASLHYRHPIDPRIIDGPLYQPFQALGLTRAQAADRLSLQADGPDLIAWLTTSVPDEYAGTALDNAAGMVDIY